MKTYEIVLEGELALRTYLACARTLLEATGGDTAESMCPSRGCSPWTGSQRPLLS
jgi:hypothetical protein